MKKFLLLFFIFFGSFQLFSQTVYEHISNTGIYDFLDEMANLKIIELNNVIKPYSKEMISEKLMNIKYKIENNQVLLNKRQAKDLQFYLLAYTLENKQTKLESNKPRIDLNKEHSLAIISSAIGMAYKDTNFRILAQPILGVSYSTNENGKLTQTRGGISLYSYIGEHLGIYTSVRDNNVSLPMMNPKYFVQKQGVPYKNFGEEGIDFSEARGGLVYSWKWGAVGIIKDHVEWGLGYNGTNIQSGRTPSFPMIKMQLKPSRWFEFNYYHGWLVSEVTDSTNSYWSDGTYRVVNRSKYIAANMFTFYLIKNLNFSFGNSIVYSDVGGSGPHLAYMIPFLFYKSVDHTLSTIGSGKEAGQNSQLFFNISSRNVKHLHLYFTWFMDDFSIGHFTKSDEFNIFSYKGGIRISNLFIPNISLTAEYTITNPFVFKHKIETITYESNSYNMGHYLRDNSKEIYLAIQYKPIRGFNINVAYALASHYDDYDLAECAQDPNCNAHKVAKFNNLIWQNQSISLNVKYEIFANTYIFADLYHQDITGQQVKIEIYTPAYYWGNTNTINMGVNMGF